MPDKSVAYNGNGNVLLDQLLGATLYSYLDGEDEAGADARLGKIAQELRSKGEIPLIVPLDANQPPTGALGYIDVAQELLSQGESFDEIFVASGSALTHCGVLFGLRANEDKTPVNGICVRRDAKAQTQRVQQRLADLPQMLDISNPVADEDIRLDDIALSPGYGQMSEATQTTILRTARAEGLFLDSVYTGKVMAALFAQANRLQGKKILFWHTGGQSALFGYADAFDCINDLNRKDLT